MADTKNANVATVVRCKDCAHSKKIGYNGKPKRACENDKAPWTSDDYVIIVKDYDYCSYGERRCNNAQTD